LICRSFGKSSKSSSSLTRSSTYEKLPQSSEEAKQIDGKHDNYNKKYDSQSKHKQNDKINGNLMYCSAKYNKNNTLSNNKSHFNTTNNNLYTDNNKTTTNQLAANHSMYSTTNTNTSKSHQRDRSSRRTCLVTAV